MSAVLATDRHVGRASARGAEVIILLVCAGVLVLMRLHAFDLPLETDEANYAYIGGRLLAGDRLYVDVWDHQPPGVFVLFAAVAAVFGGEPVVFRWLATGCSLATMFFIWGILGRVASARTVRSHRLKPGARGIGQSDTGGGEQRSSLLYPASGTQGQAVYTPFAWVPAGGAVLFALASSDPGTAGEGCNREIYMNTLILAAWLWMLRRPSPPASAIFVSGLLLGLASTLKTIIAVHWVCLAVWLVVTSIRRTESATPPDSGSADKPGARRTRDRRQSGDELAIDTSRGMGNRAEDSPALMRAARLRCRIADGLGKTRVPRWRFGLGLRFGLGTVLWFGVGPLVIWLAVFAYFAATGRFVEFWEAVFGFNLGYSGAGDAFFARFTRFFQPERHPFIFYSSAVLWLGGIVSALVLPLAGVLWHRFSTRVSTGKMPVPQMPVPHIPVAQMPAPHRAAVVFALLVAGYVTICLPAQFWPHYYYLLIPALALALPMSVGLLADCTVRYSPGTGGARRRWVMPVILAGLTCWLGFTQWRDYLSRTPYQITVKRYNSRDFFGRAHGRNVAHVTDPDDTIFVFGNDAAIYYYSKRRCASRYTMATGLREQYPRSAQRRAILLEELARELPRVILETGEPRFEAWEAFLKAHYEPIGADYHDRRGDLIMPVWGLKDRPVERIDWNWDRSQIGGG